jgi:1,6-anhydro-N-acetylmuramate kinase
MDGPISPHMPKAQERDLFNLAGAQRGDGRADVQHTLTEFTARTCQAYGRVVDARHLMVRRWLSTATCVLACSRGAVADGEIVGYTDTALHRRMGAARRVAGISPDGTASG